MAEPTITHNTITWNCDDDTGYTLSSTELDSLDWLNVRGFILAWGGTLGDELDDSDFSNWYDAGTLTQELTERAFGTSGAKAESSSANTSSEDFWAGIGFTGNFCFEAYLKTRSTTGSSGRSMFLSTGGARPPLSVMTGVGRMSDNPGLWSWYNLDTPDWEDTGIIADSDWITFKYKINTVSGTGDDVINVRIYLGKTLVHSEVDVAESNYGQPKTIALSTSQSGYPIYFDRVRGKKNNSTLYPSSGTVVTPKAQPTHVRQWRTIASSATTSGSYYGGSESLETQYSTDGGTNWGTNSPSYNDANWESATAANLEKVFCDGDGSDALRARSTLTVGTESLWTPRLESIVATYLGQNNTYPATVFRPLKY